MTKPEPERGYPKLSFVFLLGSLVSRLALSGTLTFFDPQLERATPAELTDRVERLSASPAQAPSLDLLLSRLFLADAWFADGAIHAASDQYRVLGIACDHLEDTDYFQLNASPDLGRVAAVCAIVEAELMSGSNPVAGWVRLKRLKRARLRAATSELAQDERWYLEGRLFASLPPGWGQDFKKSLVALHFLHALRPSDGTVLYWTARSFERQGNRDKALELYIEAGQATIADSRADAVLAREQIGLSREADGMDLGLRPAIFYSPATGAGLQLIWNDDRLFDEPRALRIGAEATTRGQYAVFGAFTDQRLFPPTSLSLEGSFFDGVEDFFGLGMGSSLTAPAQLHTRRTDLALKATAPFSKVFALTVGWRASGAQRLDAGPPALEFGYQNGPIGELSVDTRDSFRDPREGFRLAIGGYFPTQGMGSARTFQQWNGSGQYHYSPSLHHTISLSGGAVVLNGDAPFSAYPELGGSLPAPGIREGRYRDRNLAVSAIEYRWRFSGPLTLATFATLATVTDDSSRLLQSVWKGGGGLAWIGHLSRYRCAEPRVELGVFAGEWVLQGSVTARW